MFITDCVTRDILLTPAPSVRRAICVVCLGAALLSTSTRVRAEETRAAVVDSLPSAPSSLLGSSSSDSGEPGTRPVSLVAPKYSRTVSPGQQAEPLTSKDKFLLAVKDRASLSAVAGSAFSAGYGYLTDGSPHYGVNAPAFGQRFGAAELRATSESLFSYSLYASIFHDDPRYYVMGPQQKLTKRAVYAATRVVMTRKDDGSTAVNWSKLAGLTSAGALSNAYYPDRDRTVGRTASSVLTSVATTAGINELHEFIGDAKRLIFHKH